MRKPRVILCEDNSLIREGLEKLLKRRGYDVISSDTPIMCALYRDGMDSCPQDVRCADILITDQMMEKMTGIHLLEMQHRSGCKLDSKNKALMTASTDSYIEEKVKGLGCKFFSKPLDFSLLKEWLDACETRLDLSQPVVSEFVEPDKLPS
jgi:CheY-like chemotaxis protein